MNDKFATRITRKRIKLNLPITQNHILEQARSIEYKPKRQVKRPIIIVSAKCQHFGDAWAVVSKAARIGQAHHADIIIKTKPSRIKLVRRIIELVLCPVNITAESFDKNNGYQLHDIYNCDYLCTKTQWKPGLYNQICYQFDGRWKGGLKNPPPGDEEKIIKLIMPQVKKIRLGLPMELNQIIETAARSDLFVGIDSGMAHLCHSVGTPMFLIEYRWDLENGHKGKTFTKCFGTEDAIGYVNQYLEQLK